MTAPNILIVDDSATTRAMIRRTIDLCGTPVGGVLEAGNGNAALSLMAKQKVDLVLADLHMPEMGGVELLHRMLADAALRAIPVVIVSAEPNIKRLEQLKAEGARGYLRKPFTPEGLRNLINGVFGAAAVQHA